MPQDLADAWQIYIKDLPAVSTSCLLRHIDFTGVRETHLCVFYDASLKGYAAVVYLRVYLGSDVKIYLLNVKSKVTLVKGFTVPRHELSAALLLTHWMNRL